MKPILIAFTPLMFAAAVLADSWNTGTSGQISTSSTTTKVGVGTSGTPSEKLTVSGGSILLDNAQYLKAKLAGSSTGSNLVGVTSGNQLNLGSANSALGLSTGNITRMLIDGNGNVGVGMIPGSGRRLDVSGTARATAFEGDGSKLSNVAPAGSFPVGNYGASPALADNQAAFNSALTAAANAGGGIVFVPAGQYKIGSPLTIPRGVTLQGTWQSAHDGQLDMGTTLLVTYGGTATVGTPFINLAYDGGIRGVTIHYTGQQDPANVQDYPWTISGGFGAKIENVTITNAYRGIQLVSNSHTVRNVNMTAYFFGVYVDGCLDISRLENVHIHPKYLMNAMNWGWPLDADNSPAGILKTITDYTITHLVGFLFARTDWQQVSGCFVIWSLVGMKFIHGIVMDGGFSGTIVNSSVDISQYSVQIDYTDGFGGVSFVNGMLQGVARIAKPDIGPVHFTNCTFHPAYAKENPNKTTALIYLDAPSTVSINNSLFYDWDIPRKGNGCITVNHGVVLMGENEFSPPTAGRPPYVPAPGPERLHINLFNDAYLVASGTRFGMTPKFFLNDASKAEFYGAIPR